MFDRRPLEFHRPERVGREQLRAMGALHEEFARNFQEALSVRLRTKVVARVMALDQLTYSEFINSLPNPTIFTTLSAEPLEGNWALEVNPIIAFPIMERILGLGSGSPAAPEPALNDLQWNLIGSVIEITLHHLKDAWSKLATINIRMSQRAVDPDLVPITSPSEAVVSVSIQLEIGESKGFMNLCMPVRSLKGIME